MSRGSITDRAAEAPVGLLVDLYLNLHRTGFLSVRAAEGESRGRVIAHVRAIQLENCDFRVSESGRQRVIREKSKNVHATIRGRVVVSGSDPTVIERIGMAASQLASTGGMDVAYNPYFTPLFIDRATKMPVLASPQVVIVGKQVTAKQPS